MTGHPLVWTGFGLLVLGFLALDLGVFHRKAHAVGFREALSWTGVWVATIFASAVGASLIRTRRATAAVAANL